MVAIQVIIRSKDSLFKYNSNNIPKVGDILLYEDSEYTVCKIIHNIYEYEFVSFDDHHTGAKSKRFTSDIILIVD